VHAPKAVRALYCILYGDTDLWVAASQGPPHKFKVTAALSRTGEKCNRLVTSELQLSCNKLVLFDTELKATFSTAVHKYMYCAKDEAGSHVGSKSFRLVVGVYSQTRKELLGSAC